jgi:hypothetical protein
MAGVWNLSLTFLFWSASSDVQALNYFYRIKLDGTIQVIKMSNSVALYAGFDLESYTINQIITCATDLPLSTFIVNIDLVVQFTLLFWTMIFTTGLCYTSVTLGLGPWGFS